MAPATPLRSRSKRRRRCKIDVDVWLSLPPELLVDVFRRLGTTDVVSCAGTCKLWRRAIVANASLLRPRPDCFNPNLLLGFFYRCEGTILQRVLEPFRFTPPAITGGEKRLCDLISAASTGGVDLALYNRPLSSRDGFLLLKSLSRDVVDLCLCNPMTGSCTFLPAAAFEADAYVLLTDDNGLSPSAEPADDDVAVRIRICAVKSEDHGKNMSMTLQHFCSTSPSGNNGSWGPVMRSDEFKKRLTVSFSRGKDVVSGSGAIFWLGHSNTTMVPTYSVAAMDLRTGRTWAIELPKQCRTNCHGDWKALATTSDGRLSLLWNAQQFGKTDNIQVWVHINGARWFLRRRIHVPDLSLRSGIFWPRSGCVLVEDDGGQPLLINIDTGSSRPITCHHATVPNDDKLRYPYEMDWSTYLSKMKTFVTATARVSGEPMKKRAWRPNPNIYGQNWISPNWIN